MLSFKAPTHQLKQLVSLIQDLFHFDARHTLSTFGLIFLKSVTSGIGLLFILPLLQLIGLSFGKFEQNPLMTSITQVFQFLHLSPTLAHVLLLYIVIMCFTAFIAYAEQMTGTRLQQHYNQHLRSTLHRHLLSAQWSFFLTHKKSDLLYQLTSQTQAVSLCNHQLLNLINHLFLIAAYTGFAFLLSWPMTLLAMGSALLLLSFMLPLHVRTSKAGWNYVHQNQRMHQAITEQFGALKMIKGSGFELTCIDKFVSIGHDLEMQNQQLNQVTAKSRLLYTCSSAALFSFLLYIALGILKLPMAALLLLLIIFARILPMISNAQQMYQRILHQIPAYVGVMQLLQDCKRYQETETPEHPHLTFTNAITLTDVSFSYPTNPERLIIQKRSIQLNKNTTTAIIGPSGAGKSTLADLIAGLIEPTDGTIHIDALKMSATERLAWRKKVAYITQDVFLFNASIRENLTLFITPQTDEALIHALNLAAANFVLSLESGLDTLIGDNGVRLSGGERQRIALARALLMKPQLLILDESTNALDDDNLKKIQQTLKQLKGEMTILLISHQHNMQTGADQVILMESP